ncbi:MAG: hypothetical protein IJX82_03160 [Clostridia bacterium]|nr:hypothetical protein [Clostridia bacterium]
MNGMNGRFVNRPYKKTPEPIYNNKYAANTTVFLQSRPSSVGAIHESPAEYVSRKNVSL